MSDGRDVWEEGAPYDAYMGRWSRLVAPRFVQWLALPPGLRWLDTGCGTGALTEAILDGAAPASVVGADPSSGFIATARERLGSRARFEVAGAERLPLGSDEVDVTVSGLVLNFVPDASEALAEAERVTAPGGTVAAYVWDYAGRMDFLRSFWSAATELDPDAERRDETTRFMLETPETLWEAFGRAGLEDIDATAFEVGRTFAGFDEYWTPFLGGQGPAPAYLATLDETKKQRLRELVRDALTPAADGSIDVRARAWAVRGTVPDDR